MFSEGHIIWIVLSGLIVITGLIICRIKRPELTSLMKTAFVIGLVSEVIKVFTMTTIVPVVDPVIVQNGETIVVQYASHGEYTPYLAMEHMPMELCSLYIIFMFLTLVIGDQTLKKWLYSVMYASGVIGGIMGIVFASITAYYTTVYDYFSSARVWQYFIYHSLIVTVSLYLGASDEAGLEFRDFKKAIIGIVLLDVPTFYLNSIFSSEIYENDTIVGVTHRINFFSSYVSPFGMNSPNKSVWLIYLVIRAILAVLCIAGVFSILAVRGRSERRMADRG